VSGLEALERKEAPQRVTNYTEYSLQNKKPLKGNSGEKEELTLELLFALNEGKFMVNQGGMGNPAC